MNFMDKKTFTRQEVIDLLDELLQRPDILRDATENENTDWDAGELLKLAEDCMLKTHSNE